MNVQVLRAELFALRRRPAVWVLGAVWAVQILCFAYLVSYLVWRSLRTEMPATDAATMRESLLPASVDHTILGSLPVWGGPVMLILGALVAAGDYRWGTFRTVLSRVAGRTSFLAGRFQALAVVMLLMSVLTLLVSALSSLAVALVEGEPISWPSVGRLGLSLLAIWLITMAWAAVGFALGLVTRNLAAAIGVGLVWTLAVENIVNGLGSILPFLEPLRAVALSTSTGSVAAALGASGSAFGVAPVTTGPVAAAVLGAYTVVGFLVSAVVFRRRDLA